MKVVHWTLEENWTLRSIKIRNGFKGNGLREKPLGGLWTSPHNSKHSWARWYRGEDFHNSLKEYTRVLLTIDIRSMLTIDTELDLQKLPTIQPKRFPLLCIDFEKLLRSGVDSIYLTEEGVWNTRFSHPISLYPWDCETVLIINEKCILDWKPYPKKPSIP